MDLGDATFQGPAINDRSILARLPKGYAGLLEQMNGFVIFRGGFHIRGVCSQPTWHSLQQAWNGAEAIHKLFAAVRPPDIPFGQDALGDQYVLRDSSVHRLSSEEGSLEPLGLSFGQFFAKLDEDPFTFLRLQPFQRFEREGGRLQPGQLVNVYPPFVSKESAGGVSMRAVPAHERLRFLSDLAKQVQASGGG